MLVRRLGARGARRVYDVGVGEGTPLVTLARHGFEVAGCDIAPAMVEVARRRLAQAGLPADCVRCADIEERATLGEAGGDFDAVIAVGVLPHVRDDRLFLDNVRSLARPGGSVFIEFRNKLFALFTLNRYTKEFVLDDLLAGVDDGVKRAVAAELDARLATDLPVPRLATASGAPGYDRTLAKFHNPFELPAVLEAAGLVDASIHWYHYHPAPPLLEAALGPAFREAALRLEEQPSGWRGYFLCSAGVVEATVA
jgi:SAM-dependent methyltransferase